MEIESLFSGTRWEILQAISKNKLSPLELAQQINTTSANISQQLRLLELAGLVKSEKTSNVEKGKPRVVYSLAGDNAFLILATSSFVNKKLLMLSKYHNFLLRSLFIENIEHHQSLLKVYLKLQDHLSKISILAVDTSRGLTVYIVTTEKAEVKKLVQSQKVRVVIQDISEFKVKDLIILYDTRKEVIV